jgi:hypothetical protein
MATLITPDVIAQEALRIFENNTVMGSRVYRAYESELRGTKVGDRVRIRKPNDFTVQDGPTMVKQTVEESNTELVIDQHKHVAWEFSNTELTLSIEQYSERYIRPAVIQLVNNVDNFLTGLYTEIPNTVGTAGTTPTNVKAFQAARTELSRLAVPDDDVSLVIGVDEELELTDDLSSKSGPDGMIESAIRNMAIGRIGKMPVFMDQNIRTHTTGTNNPGTNDYQINGASQTGSTLTVDTGSGTLLVGDVITIGDDVFDVNPISKASTGRLKRFVVTANMASGGTSLSIYPAIVTSGAHQNVSAVPDDDDVITRVGTGASDTYVNNMAFHRKSIALAMVPFERPVSAPFWAMESGNGFSIAVSRDWDQNTYKESIRLDILYGGKVIRPEHAIRLLG